MEYSRSCSEDIERSKSSEREPFLPVILTEVSFCAPVLVTPVPSSSDSPSLLSLTINAVLAEDEIEEPNGVPAFFHHLTNRHL